MRKLLVGLGVLAYLGGFDANAGPLLQAAQTVEKSGEPSSGPQLSYREVSRKASPTGDFITYRMRADRFPGGKTYSLTRTLMNGATYKVPEPLHIDGSGRVLMKDGSEFDLVLGGTFPGEFMRFTLLSDDGTAKAFVEITPVLIQAVGKGGCRLTVKPMMATGEAFSIIGEGFQPGQEIKTVAVSSGQSMEGHADNKNGNLKMVLFPAVKGQSGGDASLTASDKSCSVTVRYAWGNAMPKLSPAANREGPERPVTAAAQPAPTQTPADVSLAATPTPKLSKGANQMRLAMLAVNLDDSIGFLNLILPNLRGKTIHINEDKITSENVKDVLERLQRERRALSEEIDREGFDNIAGNYEWQPSGPSECKLEKLPPDASGPVTVTQNQHTAEFKGNGPARCGAVVGTIVVLEAEGCGKASTMRLVGIARQDETISMQFYDTKSRIHCNAGIIKKTTGAMIGGSLTRQSRRPALLPRKLLYLLTPLRDGRRNIDPGHCV